MKNSEVIDYLDQTFHPEYQEDYDNSGFLVGSRDDEYKGALVALDLTDAVVDEALRLGLNLIVTHHPVIFGGVKRLTADSPLGALLLKLIQHGMSVYAAHTNLDNMAWGVSGELAARLGLRECLVLCESVHGPGIGAGIVGTLPQPVAPDAFLQQVKTLIGIPTLRTSNMQDYRRPTLQRVALCGGSGAEFIADALAAGADIYLSADLKYHDFQRTDGRMLLADIGHYESEQFAKDIIFRRISEKFSNFACRISSTQKSLVHYI